MRPVSKRIDIEGVFQSGVLGTFDLIRGFAELKELAAISVPYGMQFSPENKVPVGYQRPIDERHADDIQRYLQSSLPRFFPEVILSLRAECEPIRNDRGARVGVRWERDGATLRPLGSAQSLRRHKLRIERGALDQVTGEAVIRRVDGNHRLARADELQKDPMAPTQYTIPFCIMLLGPPGNQADDYTEALVFHTINSKAIPLDSEHSLRLILGQDPDQSPPPDVEFDLDPVLCLTRRLHEHISALPAAQRERLCACGLTALFRSAQSLLQICPDASSDYNAMEGLADDTLQGFGDIFPRACADCAYLVSAPLFIELVAHVWATTKGASQQERVDATMSRLCRIGSWLGQDNLALLTPGMPTCQQVLDIHAGVEGRVPKQIFLARWYTVPADGDAHHRAGLRLNGIRNTLEVLEREHDLSLTLIDLGTAEGGTALIHPKMYQAIASSDIILVDLTGLRPNVCVEAGYALKHHEKGRLLFMYHTSPEAPDVPFNLDAFTYIRFGDTGQIPDVLGPNILRVVEQARAGTV